MLGGAKLSKLNSLRATYFVFVDWDSNKNCIRVRSERSENDVVLALKGVRQAFKNAEAEQTSSQPLYIIVPPNEDIMRKIVKPACFVADQETGLKTIGNPGTVAKIETVPKGVILAGDLFSKEEKAIWRAGIDQKLQKNRADFTKLLSGITEKLAHFVPWMRMRVHFGHVCFTKSHSKFRNSESNFEDFVEMMKNPRLTGSLDRRYDRRSIRPRRTNFP